MIGYLPEPNVHLIHLWGDCFWTWADEAGDPFTSVPSWPARVWVLSRRHWWRIVWRAA